LDTSNEEKQKIKKPQRFLLTILLAISPIFFAQSAFAQTQAEYDALISQAQAKVDAAQAALTEAQNVLAAAQQLQIDTSNAVEEANRVLQDKQATVSQKADALAAAQSAVDQAQANYDNNLLSTPIENSEPTIPGLQADIYTFNSDNAYPNRDTSEHTFCKTITVDNIDKDWGGDDIEGCGGDFVIIHYSGFITVPTTDSYEFLAQVDDGWYMTIGDTVVNNNWVLKGCGGWWSQPIQLEGGRSYPIDAWMYEYGGGACNQLIYMNSQTWDVAPASWFSQNEQAQIVKTKDPSLLIVLEDAQSKLDDATSAYNAAQVGSQTASANLQALLDKQSEIPGKIDLAQSSVTNKQEELVVAQQELQAIPPFAEPAPTPEETKKPIEKPTEVVPEPIPEPVTPTPTEPSEPKLPVNVETVDPQSLTSTQVEELKAVANEILATSEQGSPEYEQALTALFVAAQADDIVVNEELASVPVLGATVVALTDAINFMGNVGSDMSPKVREESKKVVVTAVVAVGAAVNAATGAALTAAAPSAAASASAGGSGGTSNTRRKN
jgi:predicted  nucleic acid-binding Zn-ribbon protein